MSWNLLAARPSDAPAIADLMRGMPSRALPAGDPAGTARWMSWATDEQAIRARIADPDVTQLVVRDADGFVGGSAFVRVCEDDDEPSAYIGGLMCRVRHIDAGRRMLDACLTIAREHGCTSAYGHVFSGNRPVMMVARWLGFEEVARYDDDAYFPGHVFVVLSRRL